jgi:hypothetical protein
MYQPAANALAFLPLMPEWFLLVLCLAEVSVMGLLWSPLFLALPLLALACLASLVQASLGGARARFGPDVPRFLHPGLRALTAGLHLMQPMARLAGRMHRGLTPWRQRVSGFDWPREREYSIWTERGGSPEGWLAPIEADLRGRGLPVRRGGDWDRWDLAARCGPLGAARMVFGLEELGRGRQLARFRVWPDCSRKGLVLLATCGSFAVAAACAQAWSATALTGAACAVIAGRALFESGSAVRAMRDALAAHKARREAPADGVPEA